MPKELDNFLSIILFPLLIAAFMLTQIGSCAMNNAEKYSFVLDEDNISSIQIVYVDEYLSKEYRFEYTVKCEISDNNTFINELKSVKYSGNPDAPRYIKANTHAIKIGYDNGDYDLIESEAQLFNRSGENQIGYLIFDADQFNALIERNLAQ